MNDRVEEITEAKPAEIAAEDGPRETGAAASSAAGEQSESADGTDADGRRHSGGRSWYTALFIATVLAVTAVVTVLFFIGLSPVLEIADAAAASLFRT